MTFKAATLGAFQNSNLADQTQKCDKITSVDHTFLADFLVWSSHLVSVSLPENIPFEALKTIKVRFGFSVVFLVLFDRTATELRVGVAAR